MEKKTNESVHMEIGIEEEEMLPQTTLRRKLGEGWWRQSLGLQELMFFVCYALKFAQ